MAKQARGIEEKAEFLERYALPLQQAADRNPAKLKQFINESRYFGEQLVGVIHGERDARDVDRRLMNRWVVTATTIRANTKTTQDGVSDRP